MRIGEKGYIEGAPDLVAETASSSASYDLGDKLQAYRRNGGREYVVWRVLDRQIDWFILHQDRYEPLDAAADGILRGTVFPGLWLDPATLIRGLRPRPARRELPRARRLRGPPGAGPPRLNRRPLDRLNGPRHLFWTRSSPIPGPIHAPTAAVGVSVGIRPRHSIT